MAKRLIFSDLHFGSPHCSLRRKVVVDGLNKFLNEIGPVDEIIFAGDILDANISTLTIAMEGINGKSAWPRQLGFRKWLSIIFKLKNFSAKKIIYIPGNHDYVIWNLLATQRAFMEPVSEGKVPQNLPLMEATFTDPFIKGVAPKNYQDKFIVSYPDYEYKAGGKSYLVTHGHYLDDSQTLFESLEELVKKEKGNKSKAIKNFFKRTAEYQAVANAISFMQDQRDFVDDVFTILGRVKGFLGHWRDKRIDEEMKTAIILYLTYYRGKTLATLPDHFIFGHTHQASQSSTKHFDFDGKDRQLKRLLEICNDGSFMETKTIAGTFVLNDSKDYANPVQLYKVNKKTGKVTKTN